MRTMRTRLKGRTEPPVGSEAIRLTKFQHSYLVKMWNYTSFPNYKSRLWNTVAPDVKEKR